MLKTLSYFLIVIVVLVYLAIYASNNIKMRKYILSKLWHEALRHYCLCHTVWGQIIPTRRSLTTYIMLLFETNNSFLTTYIELLISNEKKKKNIDLFTIQAIKYLLLYCAMKEKINDYNYVFEKYRQHLDSDPLFKGLYYFINKDYANAELLLMQDKDYYNNTINFIFMYFNYKVNKNIGNEQLCNEAKEKAAQYATVYSYLLEEKC